MQELLVKNGDIDLYVQTFGSIKDPAILLIAGAAGQSILWNYQFCLHIAQSGYFVIRFDNRDTGQSSAVNYIDNPYNLDHMAEDAMAILDHLKISKAHIVGSSMGGYVAQIIAINYKERVNSLVLLMSTINSSSLRGIKGHNSLPGHNFEAIREIAEISKIPRISLKDKIKSLTDMLRVFNGKEAHFPYDELYQLSEKSYNRAKSRNAVRHHRLAILNSPPDRTQSLKKVDLPILIIHGKMDPIIPVEHAYYGKDHLSQAKLLIIEKMGHVLSSMFTDQVAESILEHIK
jgi:pimeloyl-ACP methyl ester carboxylesterase